MSIPAEIEPDTKTIIWDFDGTLLDSFGIYRDCLNEVLKDRGMPEATEKILRQNHHGHIVESIVGPLQDMSLDASEHELAEIMTAFYELDDVYIKDTDHHLFADALDLARRAHRAGIRQIVVTNRPHGVDRGNGSPRNLIANSSLHDLISDILCGDDSDLRKPSRGVLEARFGSGLSELSKMIVVGDQFVDAEFGHSIGCSSILVARAGEIAHLDRLDNWDAYVKIVPSLFDVRV